MHELLLRDHPRIHEQQGFIGKIQPPDFSPQILGAHRQQGNATQRLLFRIAGSNAIANCQQSAARFFGGHNLDTEPQSGERAEFRKATTGRWCQIADRAEFETDKFQLSKCFDDHSCRIREAVASKFQFRAERLDPANSRDADRHMIF